MLKLIWEARMPFSISQWYFVFQEGASPSTWSSRPPTVLQGAWISSPDSNLDSNTYIIVKTTGGGEDEGSVLTSIER